MSMIWILAFAIVMMIGMTALAARVGVATDKTLCGELSDRLGKPFAAFVGITLFLIVACFQFSNNAAVVASLEAFVPKTASKPIKEIQESNKKAEDKTEADKQKEIAKPTPQPSSSRNTFLVSALIGFNVLIISVLYGFKSLYKPLEKILMLLVGLMITVFGVNLFFAGPSIADVFSGLIPSFQGIGEGGINPKISGNKIVDPLWAVQGLIATTFSIAGALYQSYLVKEKGWTNSNLRQGLFDSIIGISVLGFCSAMIMITAGSVLYGKVDPSSLGSASDVAGQLAPLFGEKGQSAKLLFSGGIFAAAFSSFLVNAMIGGTLLSDGLGLGYKMDSKWPKHFTVLALLTGMAFALSATLSGKKLVEVIIFAQAMTVVGGPILAFSLLYLATRADIRARVAIPKWIFAITGVGCLLAVLLAVRTAYIVYLKISLL